MEGGDQKGGYLSGKGTGACQAQEIVAGAAAWSQGGMRWLFQGNAGHLPTLLLLLLLLVLGGKGREETQCVWGGGGAHEPGTA